MTHSAMRRISNGEPARDVLEEKSAVDREEFRSFLADMGPRGVDSLRQYDAALRDLDTGVTGARSAWHSISEPARRVLLAVFAAKGRCVVRRSVKPSIYALEGQADLLCRAPTLRTLCDRDLMAWDGGAFDPEQVAILTERAVFVITHGRPEGAANK